MEVRNDVDKICLIPVFVIHSLFTVLYPWFVQFFRSCGQLELCEELILTGQQGQGLNPSVLDLDLSALVTDLSVYYNFISP